ncbi:class I tRNA ligase family protein [Pseudonocardia sp. TRM90224]|uniref:class I tRNA ligase family protein n=1 Tax=Pseudonocardia sp. TRM90224 TaxID=2812678 RepID=UPI001E2D7E72|nr:class I tRNA ligase family protein [Pseudonocardia sp. TRM90224]
MLTIGGRPLPVVGRARMYVCGITPYDTTHLGHAATFVWADVAARVLRHLGVDVEVCRNVTDVDDVLDAAAASSGARPDSFAAVQQFRFDRDMAALGVRRPVHEPRAHNHVGQVVTLAAALLESGAAYLRGGTIWFRGDDVPARAGLDTAAAAELAAEFGHRFDADAEGPADVPLWRAARPGEAAWPSPWGEGRPGWHAECAAMALTTFGPSLDLHAGGADLRFPHHAYESAMAEAVTGVRPFARAWMHVGTVRYEGAKMAKSTGNLVLVSDVLADHPAAALRLLLVDRQWAREWDYEPAGLDAAAARLERLYAVAARGLGETGSAAETVTAALLADLDVPRALDVAEEAGGDAARLVLSMLGLALA